MPSDELCWLSALDLARLVRDKTLSPVEVVEQALARIARLNPALNAYCTVAEEHLDTFDTFKAARKLARDKRAELRQAGGLRDCRLIFAKNQTEAERLLRAPREERVVGED